MEKELLKLFCCPMCKGDLTLEVAEENERSVIKGRLHCTKCNEDYPVEEGIPNMLPSGLRDIDRIPISGNINDAVQDRDYPKKWLRWQQFDFTHGGRDTTGKSLTERSRVVSLGMLGREGLVLDAGSCDGHFSRMITEKGNVVISMDLPEVIKQTVPQNPDRCMSGDACCMPFKEASFNAIYASELIEHLLDPARFIAECRRILKTNGVLIVCTPWNECASLIHPTHRIGFDQASMSKLLMQHGIVILHIEDIPESQVMVFQGIKS